MKNESKVIAGAKRGKRKWQKQLYEHFYKKMFVICLRYTKSHLDAEDVLQESFIKVFQKIKDFRADAPIEFWIKRIVINTALSHNRSKLYQFPAEDLENIESKLYQDSFAISNYSFKELLNFIQKLPEGCQAVFNLYAIEGYKHHEIADMMKISVGTSKSQYARARSLLQGMIKEKEVVL